MGRGQQLLAVDDLQNAVVADTPCEVDAVADYVVRPGAARQSLPAWGCSKVEIGP